jgi:hypothetical protein
VEKPGSSKFAVFILGLNVNCKSFTLELSDKIINVQKVAFSDGSH